MTRSFEWRRAFALAAAGAGIVIALTPAVHGQRPVGSVPLEPPAPPMVVDGIEILHVQGQVHMLAGAGGNIAAQVGDEGLMLVDTGAPGQSQRVLNALRQLTRKPLRYLMNTSAHPDHVAGNGAIVTAYEGVRGPRPAVVGGGNPRGQNVGVLTFAYEPAFNRMAEGRPDFPGLTGDALPISTFFNERKDFYSNGEAVQLYAAPNATEDGNALVFFRGSDVVVAGDVLNFNSYPVIDLASGGTINGVIDALNQVIDLAVPERNQMGGTRVIPGRGRIANETDVVDYRDMVTIIRDRVQEMVKKGMTLDQIRAARVSLEYDGLYGATTGAWTTDMFLDAVYRGVAGRPAGAAGRTN